MTNNKTKISTNLTGLTPVKDVIPAIDLQARRIRWKTGVSETTARNIALLAYGECV